MCSHYCHHFKTVTTVSEPKIRREPNGPDTNQAGNKEEEVALCAAPRGLGPFISKGGSGYTRTDLKSRKKWTSTWKRNVQRVSKQTAATSSSGNSLC